MSESAAPKRKMVDLIGRPIVERKDAKQYQKLLAPYKVTHKGKPHYGDFFGNLFTEDGKLVGRYVASWDLKTLKLKETNQIRITDKDSEVSRWLAYVIENKEALKEIFDRYIEKWEEMTSDKGAQKLAEMYLNAFKEVEMMGVKPEFRGLVRLTMDEKEELTELVKKRDDLEREYETTSGGYVERVKIDRQIETLRGKISVLEEKAHTPSQEEKEKMREEENKRLQPARSQVNTIAEYLLKKYYVRDRPEFWRQVSYARENTVFTDDGDVLPIPENLPLEQYQDMLERAIEYVLSIKTEVLSLEDLALLPEED